MRKTIQVMTVAFLMAGTVVVAVADAPQRVAFKIAAQPLNQALNNFARQADLRIVFDTADAEGLNAPALNATLTPDEALRKLLEPTQLKAEYLDAKTIAIHKGAAGATKTSFTPGERDNVPNAGALRLAQHTGNTRTEGPANSAASTDENKSAAGADADPGRNQKSPQEIVVTARKRAERIQDVPASIAVLSSEEIASRGLVGAGDYLRGIAGVNQVNDSAAIGGQSIIIRGIQTTSGSENFYGGPTTATYFGETSTTTSGGYIGSSADIKLVDIERVEILRGPQGTAFGSAAVGGLVHTVPAAPKLGQYEGKLASNYSVTSGSGDSNYMFQAVGNLPLVNDKLAVRAVGYVFSDSGYYRNVAGSNPGFQAAMAAFGAQSVGVDERNVGSSKVLGARLSALYQATDDLKFTVSLLTQENETDGLALQNIGSFDQVMIQTLPGKGSHGRSGPYWDTDIKIANIAMEYDFGWADLFATYSHLKSNASYLFSYISLLYPVAPLGVQPFFEDATQPEIENSAEIRMSSKLEGPVNFLVGLYGNKSDASYDAEFPWVGNVALNPYAVGATTIGHSFVGIEREEKAVFGEVYWKLLPTLTLTGGARVSKYDRTDTAVSNGPYTGTFARSADTGKTPATYRANLSYQPHQDLIVYGGWSQGIRLGKAQNLSATSCDPDGDGSIGASGIPYEPTKIVSSDSVDNYEVGTKFAVLDRRVKFDATVFRIDWKDIPTTVRPIATCPFTANAATARSEGVEYSVGLTLTEALSVDIGGSYIDARLTQNVPALGFRAGDRLPGSPKMNANVGAQYRFDLAGHDAYVRADSFYVGSFYGNLNQTLNTKSGDYVKVDLAAQVAVGHFDFGLFVHNLTDQDAFTSRSHYAFVGTQYGYRMRPRTIGAQLGYRF